MRERNNIDTLRILAALTVMLSHSFPLSYGNEDREPLFRISGKQTTFGAIAVAVFFIISGYLITQSFQRSPNPLRFLIARGLRLLPALAVVLVILAFIVGPAISALPLSAYFRSSGPYEYIIINFSLVSWLNELPGVFPGNPLPGVVNGSLWTLTYEARCYLAVLVLGVCGILNRATVLFLSLAGCVAMKFHFGHAAMEFYSYFAGGCLICLWRPPLRGWAAGCCGLICVAALFAGGFRIALATAGAYLVLCIALSPRIRLPEFARWGDLSYGTYICAFPVQQAVTAVLGVWATWYLNLAISVPVVLGLAFVSWHCIEAPASRFKNRRPPAMHPATG